MQSILLLMAEVSHEGLHSICRFTLCAICKCAPCERVWHFDFRVGLQQAALQAGGAEDDEVPLTLYITWR